MFNHWTTRFDSTIISILGKIIILFINGICFVFLDSCELNIVASLVDIKKLQWTVTLSSVAWKPVCASVLYSLIFSVYSNISPVPFLSLLLFFSFFSFAILFCFNAYFILIPWLLTFFITHNSKIIQMKAIESIMHIGVFYWTSRPDCLQWWFCSDSIIYLSQGKTSTKMHHFITSSFYDLEIL